MSFLVEYYPLIWKLLRRILISVLTILIIRMLWNFLDGSKLIVEIKILKTIIGLATGLLLAVVCSSIESAEKSRREAKIVEKGSLMSQTEINVSRFDRQENEKRYKKIEDQITNLILMATCIYIILQKS